MPANKNFTRAELHEAALSLVAAYGISALDTLTDPRARVAELRKLEAAFRAQTGAAINTSRQHIARACRRLRDPQFRLPEKGGHRAGAGRKKHEPTV